MSRAEMYVFRVDGTLETSHEFRNAHRLIPVVWDDLCQRHLGTPPHGFMSAVTRFWDEGLDQKLPDDDRFLLHLTYDQALLPREEFDRAIALTGRYLSDTSHWGAVCDLLWSLRDREDILGVGFYGTSVGEDPWWKGPELGLDGDPLVDGDPGHRVDARTARRVRYGALTLVDPGEVAPPGVPVFSRDTVSRATVYHWKWWWDPTGGEWDIPGGAYVAQCRVLNATALGSTFRDLVADIGKTMREYADEASPFELVRRRP